MLIFSQVRKHLQSAFLSHGTDDVTVNYLTYQLVGDLFYSMHSFSFVADDQNVGPVGRLP